MSGSARIAALRYLDRDRRDLHRRYLDSGASLAQRLELGGWALPFLADDPRRVCDSGGLPDQGVSRPIGQSEPHLVHRLVRV
jgi:hypothetical protein